MGCFCSPASTGWIYHLSSWKQALERAFSHIKGHFLVLRDDSGHIAAGIPIYLVRSWLLGNRLVSIPYASICDPLISTEQHYKELLGGLKAFQKECRAGSIEIKTLKTTRLIADPLCSSADYIHHYLPMDRPPQDLQKNFAHKATKQMIQRAQHRGLIVRSQFDPTAISLIHSFLAGTRRRLSLPSIPHKFFNSFAQAFGKDRMTILVAYLEENPIAALLALNFGGVLHIEYYGGNSIAYQTGASHLLHWEAIKHAWSLGCKSVSFGLTDSWNEGLLSFKRRWGTIGEPIGISCISSNGQPRVTLKSAKRNRASRWLFRNAPQPVCAALASFIYRHHG
jgi:hypothetical protein